MKTTNKSFWSVLLLLTFPLFATYAQTVPHWKVDKAHTSINFSINHFFTAVTGKFNSFDGDFTFDPSNLAASKVVFTIDVNSVDTDESKRDKHLLSSDFFNASQYPKMTFVSTRFEKKSEKEYVVFGNLTIRDVSKPIALPFKITGEMEHPMKPGTLILGLAATIQLNRTDYGVGNGSWAATAIVGDMVDVSFHTELNRKK